MLSLLCAASWVFAASPEALPALPSDIPADAAQWTVLTMGSPAGQQASWSLPDGTLRTFFQFNDRGRGPKTYSNAKLSQGILVSETVDGVDYMKDAVHETFTLSSGQASWKSKAEAGQRALTGPAFYSAMFGPPIDTGLLAEAALRQGGTLALLPEGKVRVQKAADMTVQGGDGKREPVTLYSVTGLDFAPVYVWLGADGSFFASTSVWSATIRKGFEAEVPRLLDVQQHREVVRSAELAKKLAHRPIGRWLIRGANLFDAESARLVAHQDVWIEGNRIIRVVPTGVLPKEQATEVVEASGRTLLPGLWDMHAHVQGNDGMLNLAAGVTSVRDLANDIDDLAARKRRTERGEELGTRIVMAGFIDGKGPYQGPSKVLVDNEKDGRQWVDKYADLGYVQIKLYSSIKPEWVAPLAEEAHAKGLRVSGHIPSGMLAAEAVKQGYDEIQHVNFLLLNFMPDVTETRTPARFTEPAGRAADLDLNSAAVRDFIGLLKERHVTLDPTLSVFESMMLDRPGTMAVGMAAVADRLPPQVRRGFLAGNLPVPPGMDKRYRASWAKTLQLVHALWAAGIPIEAGTDALAGFSLHRELELEVEAGIPPPQALRQATLGAARVMGLERDLGQVRPGKLADMVLIDGDPTRRISDIRKASVVVEDGAIMRPGELYLELGVKPN